MATKTWDPAGGIGMDTNDVWSAIAEDRASEGVTFLGGEPFEQADAMAELAARAQAHGLSVVAFTGFTLAELTARNEPATKRALQVIDLLIDGPFDQTQFDLSRPWVGSKNQQYHFLSDRYSPDDILGIKNKLEVRILPDGTALVNGMGNFTTVQQLM